MIGNNPIIHWWRHGYAPIIALVERFIYLFYQSPWRWIEAMFWPLIEVLLWGFVTVYLQDMSLDAQFVMLGGLIGGSLLWSFTSHSNLSFLLVFLEEMYAKNTANIFTTPMGPGHYLVGVSIMSLIRILIAIGFPVVICMFLYDYNLFSLGVALAPFAVSLLLFAWSLGMLSIGLVMRYGYAMEALGWMMGFALAPFSCVFYPLDAMPNWAQPLCQLLPTTYIFEGMRHVLNQDTFPWSHLMTAVGLNLVYIAMGAASFIYLFNRSRRMGSLLNQNE